MWRPQCLYDFAADLYGGHTAERDPNTSESFRYRDSECTLEWTFNYDSIIERWVLSTENQGVVAIFTPAYDGWQKFLGYTMVYPTSNGKVVENVHTTNIFIPKEYQAKW